MVELRTTVPGESVSFVAFCFAALRTTPGDCSMVDLGRIRPDDVDASALAFFSLVIVYGLGKGIFGQNFNAELYREDLRTGGAGGFAISVPSRALRLNDAKVSGFFFGYTSVLLLCTRIRVR